jgi:hypothetical protein
MSLVLLTGRALGDSGSVLTADSGIIRLEGTVSKVYRLKGDWRFVDRNLKGLEGLDFDSLPLKSAYTGLPYWTSYVAGPARGAFILAIDSTKRQSLSVYAPAISARSQIRLINAEGNLVVWSDPEYGQESLERTRRELSDVMIPVVLEPGRNYLICNYEQKPVMFQGQESVSAGFNGRIDIGPHERIQDSIYKGKITLLIPTGIFFSLAIYSVLIYVSRRGKDLESLLMFGFNIMMFAKEVASQNMFGAFFTSNPFTQAFSSLVMSIPHITTFFGCWISYLLCPRPILKYTRWVLLGMGVVGVVVNCITALSHNVPNIGFIHFGLIGILVIISNLILLPTMTYVGLRTKNREVTYLALGYFALAAGWFFDFYKTLNAIDFPWMSMWGASVLSIVFARNNSKMFALTYERSEQLNHDLQVKNTEVRELNASLEVKVLERTAEVRSLLQHIPQGILTIEADGQIGANFSAHLPVILGQKEIANRSFKDIIFDRSNLSKNSIDQAWQTILSTLGESYLNFEVNEVNLPIEFGYQSTPPKVLKCTWNIEVDADENVKKILVTLLDVTAEVKARADLDAKNREFQIVRQLVEIGSTKCKQFFMSGQQLLSENRHLIASGAVEIETVKILFVNMHTIKGAARTLALTEMSDTFHSVESYYGEILRDGVVIDLERLTKDCDDALEVFERYERVNREVLGRTEDDSKVSIDRTFLEQNFQILNYLDQAEGALASDLREIIHGNCDKLVKLIFMSLHGALEEVMKQSQRIARDLQKAEPYISLEIGEIMIGHKQEHAIKNSFIHLLRNSLDHGIESPEVRVAKGKDPRGRITVAAETNQGFIHLKFFDDGAGLAIGRLREKGLSLQLIPEDADIQAIGELIFHQGMSTAKAVSQISGRGVGMDAVRRFIEAEGGKVELHVGACIDPEEEMYQFHLLMKLPNTELTTSQKVA